ncbi:hypothetical protein Aduo_009527 [Ancylostoma duodenale]
MSPVLIGLSEKGRGYRNAPQPATETERAFLRPPRSPCRCQSQRDPHRYAVNSSSSTHQAHVSSSSDEDCSHRELRLPPSSSRHHPYANPGKFGISSSIYPDEHSWHPRASLTEATVRFQML